MIELIDPQRCTQCNICIRVCPTDVFDRVPDAPPAIARQDSCQTCFMCEVHCPVDAMYVAPLREPVPADSVHLDLERLKSEGYLGSYRHRLGWGDEQHPPHSVDDLTVLAQTGPRTLDQARERDQAAGGRVTAPLELSTDVLVIGGGPAATWAALTARSEGARVVLVDKGMCGSSGVAPAATVGHWWVEPGKREEAIRQRDEVGGNLSERNWMLAVAEETWRRWPEVSLDHGYPAAGSAMARLGRGLGQSPNPRLCQGPVYMREMRRRVSHSGVRILDHSPALELLVGADGEVAGAAGVQRQKGRAWRIRAGAVILATGGCAWKSGSLGSNVNTGDGYLMGAEAGVALSGMEFSNYFGTTPKGGTMDKNGFNMLSTFYDADGNVVQESWSGPAGAGGSGAALVRAHLAGPIFQRLDLAPVEAREGMRAQMPNFFITLDRLGINPFEQRFEIEPINEGTVRGHRWPADRRRQLLDGHPRPMGGRRHRLP